MYAYVKIVLLQQKAVTKVGEIHCVIFPQSISRWNSPARTDPCAPHNPCRNGRCISNERGGFQCKCRTGWTGRRCDQGT